MFNSIKLVFYFLSPVPLLFFFLPIVSLAAEGDLVWTKLSNPSAVNDIAEDITHDSTGIYVAGNDFSLGNTNSQWRIEKSSLSDGSLLWEQASNPSSDLDSANAITIDSTGIYVAGYDTSSPSDFQWRIEKRSLTDGSLLWVKTNNFSAGNDFANAITVDSTGVYVAGIDSVPGNYQWRIEKRSLTDGSLLWERTNNPSLNIDDISAITIDSTGIYVAGYDRSSVNSQWRIEKRSLTDGSLLWVKTNNLTGWNEDVPNAITVDPTGVYVAGADDSLGTNNLQWRIEKRSLSDGSLLWQRTSNPSSNIDHISAITIGSAGNYYVAGVDGNLGNNNLQWRIEKRSLSDGSLLWERTSNPSSNIDGISAITIGSTGIYVAGYDLSLGGSNYQWRIEKREPAPDLTADSATPTTTTSATATTLSATIKNTGTVSTGASFSNFFQVVNSSVSDLWTERGKTGFYSLVISSTGQYQTSLADPGKIYTSSDYGVTWVARGQNGIWKSVAMSSTGQYQTAVSLTNQFNPSGLIYTSSDYGVTWTETVKELDRGWRSVAMSSDGKYQTAGGDRSVYVSSDYGVTWTARVTDKVRAWESVALSSTGQYQTAIVAGESYGRDILYLSSNFGVTWMGYDIAGGLATDFSNLTISSTGQYQTVTNNGGKIYDSTNYGASWIARAFNANWYAFAMSSDGKYQTGGTFTVNSPIYTSSDYGATWTARTPSKNWFSIAMSSTGQYQTAVANPGAGDYIYASSDYGVTWTARGSVGKWYEIALSPDGKYQTAVATDGTVITSFYGGPSVATDLTATTMPALSAGGSATASQTYTFPTSGTYSIRACADKTNSASTGTITESNEDNNCGAWTDVAVGSPSDLTVDPATPTTTAVGEATELSAVVKNTGPISTGASFSNFFQVIGAADSTAWTATGQNRNWWNITLSSTGQYQTAGAYNGQLYTSSNYGVSWTARFQLGGGAFFAALSSTGQYQTAVQELGMIYTSSDYGVTWVSRESNRMWWDIAMSSTGQYQTAVVNSGKIYTSSDYGVTWVAREQDRWWNGGGLVMSSTGQYQTATVYGGQIYTSSDYGVLWTARDQDRNWQYVAMSSDGKYQTAPASSGATPSNHIYTSSDYGVTWTARQNMAQWSRIAMSSTGQYQVTGIRGLNIHTSSDYGVTWTERGMPDYLNKYWSDFAVSSTGQYQTALDGNGKIYISSDYGANWGAKDSNRLWRSVRMSSDGKYQTAVVDGGQIYTSNFYGNTAATTDLTATTMPALSAGGSATASQTYTFPTSGTYSIRACADKTNSASTGTITESNEDNNCGAWTDVAVGSPQPNLTAGAIAPTPAGAGTVTSFSATISNIGGASVETSFTILFQFDSNADHAEVDATQTVTTEPISANGTATASVTYTFPIAGTWYVRACADNNDSWTGTITESNEGNNCGTWTEVVVSDTVVNGSCSSTHYNCTTGTSASPVDGDISYTWSCDGSGGGIPAPCSEMKIPSPDLTVDMANPAVSTINFSTTLFAVINNTGSASTISTFPAFFQVATKASGGGTITDLTATTMSTLSAGSSATASQTYTFPTSGTYSIRACADKTNSASTGTITESNENNNCGAWTDVAVVDERTTIKGSCFSSHYYCTVGISADNTSDATSYTWTCLGLNGGGRAFCSEEKLPDLIADTADPVTATVDNEVAFSVLTHNIGPISSVSSFTSLFQFDSNADHAEVDATQTVTTEPISANGTATASVTYTFPIAGTWYVRACADNNDSWTGTITESNEGNNCGTWTEVVVSDTVVNGSCSSTHYNCTTGTSERNAEGTSYYRWDCVGSSRGVTDICTELKSVDGSCGSTNNACTEGTLNDTEDSATNYLWSCLGQEEGSDTPCSLPKSSCGNTTCDAGESLLTCPQDCRGTVRQF